MENSYQTPTGIPRTRSEFDEAHAGYISENYKNIFTKDAIEKNKDLFSNVRENKYKIYWLFVEYATDRAKLQKYLLNSWKPTQETFMKYIDTKNPNDILYLKENYLSILHLIDTKLSDLLNYSKNELSNNTVIILRSDHGEEFMEHGRLEHGNNLYQELIHTPLIIKVPGFKQTQVNGLTQDVDLMPTVLELLGIPIPLQVQGKSLIPMMLNRSLSVRDYQIAQKRRGGFCVIFPKRKSENNYQRRKSNRTL